jgi:cytidylate kinase
MEKKSIAIDGPAGAGKSTLAKMAARHFGLIYVDTGAIYRCVGLFALKNGADTRDQQAVSALLDQVQIELKYDEQGVQRMILNGGDVSEAIRMPEVSIAASNVSAMPPVRAKLLSMPRDMAKRYNVIMDGRDIGTVVLPDAGLKIFLTADAEKRAKRRYDELQAKHVETTYEDVLQDMRMRDKNDSSRAAAPLKQAEDAVLVDTSEIGLDESFERIRELISGRLGL